MKETTVFLFWILWNLNLNCCSTSMTLERGKGIFSKIACLKSVHCKKKDELCSGIEVKIFTKSLCIGGVKKIYRCQFQQNNIYKNKTSSICHENCFPPALRNQNDLNKNLEAPATFLIYVAVLFLHCSTPVYFYFFLVLCHVILSEK